MPEAIIELAKQRRTPKDQSISAAATDTSWPQAPAASISTCTSMYTRSRVYAFSRCCASLACLGQEGSEQNLQHAHLSARVNQSLLSHPSKFEGFNESLLLRHSSGQKQRLQWTASRQVSRQRSTSDRG